tara:strand:+ start:1091 stop:1561 length:471 start_codon:yes stop_codon:yes gene_type:complete
MNTEIHEIAQEGYQCTLVPTAEVGRLWKDVRDILAPAVERSGGRWTMEHLYHSVITENQWLWVAFDPQTKKVTGALTTQIIDYPSSKRMAFQFLGGTDFDGWFVPMLGVLESCAKRMGCDGTEGTARMGFKPWLVGADYDMTYAVYDKVFGGLDDE